MSRRGWLIAMLGLSVLALAGWTLVVRPALDTPERRIAAYLAATGAGDERSALEAWVVYRGGVHPRPELLARRSELTHDLSTLRVGRTYTVRSVDWWRTCCEPGRVEGERNAGLARVHVMAVDAGGAQHDLVFEVWVRTLTWWGAAAGETIKDWTLYEVRHAEQSCVFGSRTYGC